HLVVAALRATARDLAVLHWKDYIAGQWRLVARLEIWRLGFPAIALRRHNDAATKRRRGASVQQRRGHQAERQRNQADAPGGHHGQNQAPQSATVCATAQGSTRPVSARNPLRARPTAASSGIAPSPYRGTWMRAKTRAPATMATAGPASSIHRW